MEETHNRGKSHTNLKLPEELYLSPDKYTSPLPIGSLPSELDMKNSDWNLNFSNSRRTSFHFDFELCSSSNNLPDVALSTNEDEITKLRNAANNGIGRSSIQRDLAARRRRKFSEDPSPNTKGNPKRHFSEIPKLKQCGLAGNTVKREDKSHYTDRRTKEEDKASPNAKLNLNLKTPQEFAMPVELSLKRKTENELQLERKLKRIRKRRRAGCTCRTTNCLKLHCVCFKKLGYCNLNCRCKHCLNRSDFESTRKFAIEKTRLIFSNAFTAIETTQTKDIDGNDVQVFPKGCKCKTGCLRNYCDCKKARGNCSYICQCEACENQKVELPKEELKRIFKPASRKKHKLVIKYEPDKPDTETKNVIEFKKYKNSRLDDDNKRDPNNY